MCLASYNTNHSQNFLKSKKTLIVLVYEYVYVYKYTL